MTQEILDYLLIRSLLANSTSEEIINMIENKEIFVYLINSIASLMQQEDFILINHDYQEKVSDIVQSHRFDYNQDKDLNEQMNYIIGRLKEYEAMSFNRKQYLINSWMKQEFKNRGLPWIYQTPETLFCLISLDMKYFQQMIELKELKIDNLIEYFSILNIILNKFPNTFSNDPLFLEIHKKNCMMIQEIPQIPHSIQKMNKKIVKKLKENYEVNEEIHIEVENNVTYQLKKKKEN